MKRQRNAGFTLMELMITLVIISVLTAIALPSYKEHVIRSRVTEAFSALSAAQPAAEQVWANTRSYATFAPGSGGFPTDSDNFAFTVTGASPSAYLITATGKATVLGYNYTIDQSGNRKTLATGWGKASNTCWVDHKDGTCVH